MKSRSPQNCLLMATMLSGCGGAPPAISSAMDPFTAERETMVRTQIEARGVKDAAVLAAMRRVPRHEFVPARLRSESYNDNPLPIGDGQTISQPYIVALMTELLHVESRHRILEIGTGSGYQAAVLAELGAEVFTIEIVPKLAADSAALLKRLGYERVHARAGDGYLGWPEEAPFDRIILTAAPPRVPQPLIDQLKPGGRLVVPEGVYEQELVVYTKSTDGKLKRTTVLPVRFVPMTGEAQKR